MFFIFDHMEQTMWEINGLRIAEPMTVVTNMILFIVCTYCAVIVMRGSSGRYDFVKKYSLFLLFTGISALLGGIFSHGFKYYFGLSYSLPGWLIALGGAYYASVAAFRHGIANNLWADLNLRKTVMVERLLLLLLFLAITLTMVYMHFLIVTLYTAVCISIIGLIIEINIYRKTRNEGSYLYIIGIGTGFLVLFIYLFKLGLSASFNHNDVAHIIMTISMIILMRSFQKMGITKINEQ